MVISISSWSAYRCGKINLSRRSCSCAVSWFVVIRVTSLAPLSISLNGLFAKVFGAGAWLSEPNGLVIESGMNGAGTLLAACDTGESDASLT